MKINNFRGDLTAILAKKDWDQVLWYSQQLDKLCDADAAGVHLSGKQTAMTLFRNGIVHLLQKHCLVPFLI